MGCKKGEGKKCHLLLWLLFLLTVEEGSLVAAAWDCVCEPRRYLPARGLCGSNVIGKD